jgi:hypothetical protein
MRDGATIAVRVAPTVERRCTRHRQCTDERDRWQREQRSTRPRGFTPRLRARLWTQLWTRVGARPQPITELPDLVPVRCDDVSGNLRLVCVDRACRRREIRSQGQAQLVHALEQVRDVLRVGNGRGWAT